MPEHSESEGLEIQHHSLLAWMAVEEELDRILAANGVADDERIQLFQWGQEKWVELLDRTGSLRIDRVDKVQDVIRDTIEQVRQFYIEILILMFVDLLILKYRVDVYEIILDDEGLLPPDPG